MRDKNDLRRSPTTIISPNLGVYIGGSMKNEGAPLESWPSFLGAIARELPIMKGNVTLLFVTKNRLSFQFFGGIQLISAIVP
ncbi:hypothetical protein AWQ24_10065 [Picosynechococcus sp. PCC 8807]|uniref:hypothetical protein n=2 Tax=Picosynechococcus sp. PCC 8807 TaxID=195248 RepID=UPI000810B75D|nr:hypothetical protein [Picosynechococcus sp. PCC 8807]ANV90951.1 hypothetical protein AWQ24_10065 [Picosynechococcus sp. PCC 8807]